MKRGGSQAFDTQRTSYTEHAGKTTSYLRILRVTYAKAYFDSGILSTPSLQLTCKTFLPVQLTSGILMPKFEGLTQTRTRMEAWLKATGARVLSVETIAMRLFNGGEPFSGVEASFIFNRGNRNEYFIFVINVYMDGHYPEPPPELLPPTPVIEEGCCVLF
ncbi:uncharacterized protein LOC106466706 [Limulus polyphemus]|uniref:Uncharacterized protein LOC106466706 n=1 Tax=Limulus polyphemus TaxID=6850 RepID=A0ABM1T3N1_LIMPO|nr:uncharacterized protein LOC106466706 [Limulus polyphemus]